MPEQSTTPTKSADDVKPSTARSAAEREGARSSRKEPRNPVVHQEGPHPMTGKSMQYITGPGREAYTEGMYESDKINSAEHFNR